MWRTRCIWLVPPGVCPAAHGQRFSSASVLRPPPLRRLVPRRHCCQVVATDASSRFTTSALSGCPCRSKAATLSSSIISVKLLCLPIGTREAAAGWWSWMHAGTRASPPRLTKISFSLRKEWKLKWEQ